VLFRSLPVRDRVVLASTHASRLSGSLEAIRAELDRRGLPVVVLTRPGFGLLGMLVEAIRAEYYLATSSVFVVDDYFFPLYVVTPKPGVSVIQTWHASGAFKKIGYSLLGKSFGASEGLVGRVNIHSNYTHILMGSQSSVPAYAEAFHQPAEKFVTNLGIPRTDLFFDEQRMTAARSSIRERYNVPADRKVLLYAPTFRGANKFEASFKDDLDLAEMRRRCGDEYVLLLRLHPLVAATPVDPALADFVRDASDHPDINELLIASDLLVTDYSSVIFEYSLLGRPMVFFAPDLAEYEAERGFYFPYREWVPGPVFTSTEPLAAYVAAGEFDSERSVRFRADSFEVADGHATERFVDELVLPALGGIRNGAAR